MTEPLLPLIIEPARLQALIGEENPQDLEGRELLIVDLCSEQLYQMGHVPGAVHVSPRELICGMAPAPGKLPDEMQLSELFSRLGLTDNTWVVAYDDEGGGWAGRFIWTLDVIGHKQASYLNGGIWAWKASGGPLENRGNHPTPREIEVHIDHTPVASLEDIVSHLNDPAFAVWDARGLDEFRGEKVLAVKGGHIPGAINCEWVNLMDRQRDLRIRADAERYLAALGLTKDKQIVTHCQTHHRSGFTYLVGKSLGFDIKAYDGSWSEWGNHPDTPVET